MIRVLLFLSIFVSSQGFAQETNLEYFSLSFKEIQSQGSIVYYSDTLNNIETKKYLAIEGWDYDIDSKEYKYFCFVKIGNTIHKLKSISQSEGKSKKSEYKNRKVSLSIETRQFKKAGYDSYFVKGKLTLKSGASGKSYDIFGLVAV